MVPQNQQWEEATKRIDGGKVAKRMRYATKKEKDAFDAPKLREIVSTLSPPYSIRAIDQALYSQIMASDWAVDLCSNYPSWESYEKNGVGFVVLKGEEIVSGASSFTYYREGIEIEVDTREDERRKGLAMACCASLILACLDRKLYPSWDAHNKGSLALAEKLGYHFDKEYPTYEFV